MSKKYILSIFMFCIALTGFIVMSGCAESKKVADKSGAQLWAENCMRCHNTPSPTTFNEEQWKTIGFHMQTRALLTNHERDKIITFLQSFLH